MLFQTHTIIKRTQLNDITFLQLIRSTTMWVTLHKLSFLAVAYILLYISFIVCETLEILCALSTVIMTFFVYCFVYVNVCVCDNHLKILIQLTMISKYPNYRRPLLQLIC